MLSVCRLIIYVAGTVVNTKPKYLTRLYKSAIIRHVQQLLEVIMRLILASIGLLVLSGCALSPPLCPGTRSYDPQICRGEKWQRIPNFEQEAIKRRQRGEYW